VYVARGRIRVVCIAGLACTAVVPIKHFSYTAFQRLRRRSALFIVHLL